MNRPVDYPLMKTVPNACSCRMLCSIHNQLLAPLILINLIFPAFKIVLVRHVVTAFEGKRDYFLASLFVAVP
jgi:hypothetical protein